ncbi:MAG TPA: hypothetical protein ENH11_00595 [Candidatus Acetothermia bacterium]|nr:hypothetical protein [Candidatus Acetothermia bacterium]
MSRFFYLFGNLLGAMSGRIGALFLGVVGLILAALLIFAAFFLVGETTAQENNPALAPGEIVVYLSPKLSSDDVQSLYLKIRDMPETRTINYRFAQELGFDQAGGLFIVQAVSDSAAASLKNSISQMPGVTNIDSVTKAQGTSVFLSNALRLGLLVALIVSIAGSLILARHAFSLLLDSFSSEIRLLRLAGTPERVIQPPVVALGVLCGVISSMLLVVVVYLLHFLALSHPQATIHAACGLLLPGRVLMVSLVGSLIGIILGGMIGLLGASLTSRKRFQIYS